VKFDPETVTDEPRNPLNGLNPDTFGVTTKFATLNPDPSAVTTCTFPVDASAGTVAFNDVAVTFVTDVESTPLNLTVGVP
jgi:hypothetical protein